jgi:hypothetical protein
MSAIAFSVPENLAFESYTQLIEAINEWLDRSDLNGSAPAMIALCEARLRRELQPLVFELSAPVVVTDGTGELPPGFDSARGVSIGGNPVDEVSPVIGQQFAPGTDPVGYSLEAGSLRIWPAWTGTATLLYRSKLPALSEANQSNEVLIQHPDVYFFGAMMFAEGFLANDSRAAVFKVMWDEAIESLRRYYIRQRRDRPRLRNPAVIV